jgi:uncharacterized protein
MMNIDFPYRFDSRYRTASTDENEHIRDMIEQFLFTNAGERVNRPDFGSGLLQMVFAPNSQELAATLQFTVQSGLQQWLGDIIEVLKLDVRSEEAKLWVEIVYRTRRSHEVHRQTFTRSIGG